MARSLNKVILIGNLTRDPELRYTPQGTAVTSFSIATNRTWKNDNGEPQEEAEFHRVVAWRQLAEICSKLLGRGDQIYAEGRLQTRDWETKEGEKRQTSEIVLNEMILLQSRSGKGGDTQQSAGGEIDVPDDFDTNFDDISQVEPEDKKEPSKKVKEKVKKEEEEDDIPF